MKRTTVLLPLLLPRLSDKAAVQFVEVLRELLAAIEHHYTDQIQRYRKHQRKIQHDYSPSKSNAPFDPPF